MASVKVSIDGAMPRGIVLTKAQVRAATAFFAERSAARSGRRVSQVAVILQNDAESAEVHKAIMAVDGATDVITQPYDPLPGEAPGVYGELFVNCDQALRVAPRRRGWSPAKELLLYIAHGADHLTGADDLSPRDYARMRRRELLWIRQYESQQHS